MGTKTAANPYMQGGNPFMQAQDAGAAMAPMPDDRNDGPANPPMAPAPVTTVQPTTTRPRTMPNGAPDPVSPQAGGDTTSSDMPPSAKESRLVPIICHACGQRGIAPMAKLTTISECSCGSDDLDLDFTVEGSWETDIPMGMVDDTTEVAQPAKCSNCLEETMVTATDPAAPMPPCPNCGAELLTAAGATLASLQMVAGDPFGSMPEGGIGTTLLNMLNFARHSPDSGKIPGWFMRFFKGMLLPEEIASGYFVQSEAGGSLQMGFAKKMAGGGIVPSLVSLTDGDFVTFEAEGVRMTVVYYEQEAIGDLGSPVPGATTGGFEVWWGDKGEGNVTRVPVGPDPQAKRYHAEDISQRFLDRVRSGRRYSSKEGAPYKGPPKMPKTPVSPGAGKGEDPEAARKKYEREQKRIEQERKWNQEGDERARKLIPDHFKAKIEEITAGILASNPSMPPAIARRVATETVERYPKVAGSRG